jgi:hypothetical protein
MPQTPWRTDPALAGKFHPDFPDDLQIVVHDGEPRRVGRKPELCWVRVVAAEQGPERPVMSGSSSQAPSPSRAVYVAELLSSPFELTSVKQGDSIRFLADPGSADPVSVTSAYLAERAAWQIQPCRTCGAHEGLDPPAVMAATRFPDVDSPPLTFTSHCSLCGGLQLLQRIDAPGPDAR